jgi:hypothetical protein
MRRWRVATGLLAALTIVTGVACDSKAVLDAFGADVIPRLEIAPKELSLEVGRTAFLMPRLAGQVISGTIPQWSSSDPDVAVVDASGNVTCIGVGTATIFATIDRSGDEDSVGFTQVTCVAPRLIELSLDEIRHVHVIGESPCPDAVGDFTITNRGSRQVTVDVDPGSPALRAGVSRVQLQPGESVVVALLFDCSSPASFRADVTVTATEGEGVAQVETVGVEVTVQR